MLLKGSIYAVYDPNMAIQCLQNSKVLYIGESQQNLPAGIIPCSVLLPPFQALDAEVNGDMNLYSLIYTDYLSSEACYNMFATILVALHSGINITLYIEEGEGLSHGQFLLQYMNNMFGIKVGTSAQDWNCYNPIFDAQNSIILYTYMDGFISIEELLMTAPIDSIVQMDVAFLYTKPISKLINDLDLKYDPHPIEYIANYQRKLWMLNDLKANKSLVTIEE